MRCRRLSFFSRPRTAIGAILVQVLLAAMVPGLIIAQAQDQCDNGKFCCNCELTWITEHPDCGIDAYNKLYNKYCDKNGDLKSTTGNLMGTQAEKTELEPYPRPELLTPANSKLERFVVLDVRDPKEYSQGHISGARNLCWKYLQPGGILDQDLALNALRKTGINNSDKLLVYDETDGGASYVFWALSYLGHENVSLLDGGIDGASGAGTSLERSVPMLKESNYTSHIIPWLLVNITYLGSWINRSDVQILDARDYIEWGKSRLTNNSIPLDASKLYQDNHKIKDAKTLADLLGRRGLDKYKTQLVYGAPEANSLFYALKLMGYNATLLECPWWKSTKWAVSVVR
jgi:thiosulfate/3-mercaptopyruvate sulfurtransferase